MEFKEKFRHNFILKKLRLYYSKAKQEDNELFKKSYLNLASDFEEIYGINKEEIFNERQKNLD